MSEIAELPKPKEGEEPPRISGTGSNQTGKKRGPYKKEAKPEGAAPAKKKAESVKMPVPKMFTDALADAPYLGLGVVYRKKTGRQLVIPGAGDLSPKLMGPEQIRGVYEAGHQAWDEMMKAWDWKLPPWAVYLLSVFIAAGGAAALDQINAMHEAISKMPPEKRAEVEAAMRAQGVPVPERNGAIHAPPPEAPEPGAYAAPTTID